MSRLPNWVGRIRPRLLPYPSGKLFAFTIVDDTDGQTLEITRAVYDELLALGLKTTKTVWVTPPASSPTRPSDEGDTLDSPEYVRYLKRLQSSGFEIALHNVSSQSNTREAIAAGLDRFRATFGTDPKMNIHHEKNRENIYFDVANDPSRLPGTFRSPIFRAVRGLRSGWKPASARPARSFGCEGEKAGSPHFWGDICRERIRYVRTNVFTPDLNTIRQCPAMPVAFPDTPYVNYWFYSSEGQDAAHFNRILSERNVRRVRSENGTSLLYTHFGKGFVTSQGGRCILNPETKARLRCVAAQEHGWFAPAGEVLDRLLAFQQVRIASFAGGFAIRNDNAFSVRDITVVTRREAEFHSPEGSVFTADRLGRLVIGEIGARQTLLLLVNNLSAAMKNWLAPGSPGLWLDLKEVAWRLSGCLRRVAPQRSQLPKGLVPKLPNDAA